ncbi:MAG TPA: hypothetical protein VGP80_10430 [Gemmatimonadales bacterium]|jgi:hypothetical protein|nr:hypothetical protein [Gemmatimonadales bacterium]
MFTGRTSDERGVALILTLFLSIVVAGMAVGVILMASNSNLISKFHANEAMMAAAADAGLEKGRDTLNGTPNIVPVGLGFVTLESNAVVRDANGVVIPGFTRSLYAGENGDTTGQFGSFASVIAVISTPRGAVVVRRIQLKQDSFSRFARFFNTWTCCMWGNTEVLFGPVHSNQGMAVQTGAPGTTFNGPGGVTTVGTITNQASATFNGGVTTGVPVIPFPTVATLANLQGFAVTSGTVVAGYPTIAANDPDTRIEFIPVDLNNDGDFADANEGFFRVFKMTAGGTAAQLQAKRAYVTARRWQWGRYASGIPGAGYPAPATAANDPNVNSPNCGGTYDPNGALPPAPGFYPADSIFFMAGGGAAGVTAVRTALNSAARRCYLGGDPRLTAGLNYLVNGYGSWLPYAGWGGAPPAALVARINANPLIYPLPAGVTATQLANTFWPITRAMNPNFKGIIYVNGSVAVSGLLRGRVTIATTGDVSMADDINYVTPPNTTCADILGVLTQTTAWIENNSVNTPFNNNAVWTAPFDDTPNEIFEGFFLTLGTFQGEAFAGDPAVSPNENCGGKSRGCKSIHGGTIQQGIAATFTGNSGWAEQDTYDVCGLTSPPPYYPTTGRFTKNRYYEMDPVGFSVAQWFINNQ